MNVCRIFCKKQQATDLRLRLVLLQFLFLGFCIHPGKQAIQHGNKLVVALVRLAAEMDKGDVHQVAVFI